MLHHVARQRLRQRLARRLAPRRLAVVRRSRFVRLRWRGLRYLLLEITEDQFELLDRAAQLLRRGAEPLAQQPGQAQLELLVAQHLFLQSVAHRLQFGCMLILAFQ
jgi:hypothetical protein